jgi:predicted membrane protein
VRNVDARFYIGLVVLALGLLVAVELIASVHLPIIRIILAIALVIIGARMLVHAWTRRNDLAVSAQAVLASKNFSQSGVLDRDARFDVVLGRGMVDLSGLEEPESDVTITIETLFGHAIVKLPPAIAYDVEGSSAFGEVRMPDRTATAMGSLVYRAHSDHRSRLHLRVSAIFGACQIVEDHAALAAVS